MTIAVELRNVSKSYGEVAAAREVSFAAETGQVFGVLGPSGAGKTTLLRLIDLLESPDSGEVLIGNREVSASARDAHLVRERIGMVLQKPVVLNRSVAHNLGYSMSIRGWDEKDIAKKVSQELKRLGLEARARKNARTLSGGEMQRLSFSRATVFSPDLLLLDEFAANLDPRNVALLEEMVRAYLTERSDRAVVLVTHNIFQAKRLCHRIALMWDGEIIEVAEKEKFFESPDDERTAAFVRGDVVY
jgi:tungstate transport system ATP-binding protein